ncbi:MAG: ABC transporter permease subunit [Anaerolineales bacterium]|nr:ABC transporter permease subunit [Anaerolineales bacterium]
MDIRQSEKRRRFLTLGLVCLVLAALLLPFLPQVIWSFSHRWLFPSLLPTEWGLRGWSYVFSPGARLGRAIITSLTISATVSLLSILVGLPAGRALGLYRFRGKTLVQFLILSPAIVPAFAAAMGIHIQFIRYGLADTFFGVVLVQLIPTLPYVVLILGGVFSSYRIEVEEEARTLGANQLKVLWYVTLPSILPGVIVAGLFAFMISWGQYLLTLLIGGGQVLTLPILLLNFVNSGDYTLASVLSLILIIPSGTILWYTSRYLTREGTALGGFGKL